MCHTPQQYQSGPLGGHGPHFSQKRLGLFLRETFVFRLTINYHIYSSRGPASKTGLSWSLFSTVCVLVWRDVLKLSGQSSTLWEEEHFYCLCSLFIFKFSSESLHFITLHQYFSKKPSRSSLLLSFPVLFCPFLPLRPSAGESAFYFKQQGFWGSWISHLSPCQCDLVFVLRDGKKTRQVSRMSPTSSSREIRTNWQQQTTWSDKFNISSSLFWHNHLISRSNLSLMGSWVILDSVGTHWRNYPWLMSVRCHERSMTLQAEHEHVYAHSSVMSDSETT